MITWRKTERFGHPEVFALIALASFLVARFVPVLGLPFTCPAKAVLGIPCATCGMTHAFVYLAHGRIGAAIGASPLGAALAAGGWAFAALDLGRAALGLPMPVPSARATRAALGVGAAALLANWAWLLAQRAGA